MEDKICRPNRHSNPSKQKRKKGHFLFFKRKNRGVHEILRAMA